MVIKYIPYKSYPATSSNETVRKAEQRRADVADLQRSVRALAVMGGNAMMTELAAAVGGGIYNSLTTASQALSKSVEKSRSRGLTEIHQRVAEDALVSMVQAFPQGKTRPYRNNLPDRHGRMQRDAGGKLLAAISSPNMFRANRDGIDFINPVWLDSQARQWYRISFGAGKRGSSTPAPKTQRVYIFGDAIPGDFGLAGYKPSRPFSLPPGYWFSEGAPSEAKPWGASRGDDFGLRSNRIGHISRKTRQFVTREPTPSLGFAGNRYLDAGVNRMLYTLPREYDKMFQGWFKEFTSAATVAARKGPLTGQDVTGRVKEIQRTAAMLNRIIRDRQKLYLGSYQGFSELKSISDLYEEPF